MRGRKNNEEKLQICTMLPTCRVCGEAGTGFHYGVTTCGACKGFFRRSIVREEPYVCTMNQMCQIGMSASRRQSCPKCRYDKCIAVGMSKHACKVGRYSLTKKSKDMLEALAEQDDEPTTTTQPPQSTTPSPGSIPASVRPHGESHSTHHWPHSNPNHHYHHPQKFPEKRPVFSGDFLDSPKSKKNMMTQQQQEEGKDNSESNDNNGSGVNAPSSCFSPYLSPEKKFGEPSSFIDDDVDDGGVMVEDDDEKLFGFSPQKCHQVLPPGMNTDGVVADTCRVSTTDSYRYLNQFEDNNYNNVNQKKSCEEEGEGGEDSHFFMNYYMGNPDESNNNSNSNNNNNTTVNHHEIISDNNQKPCVVATDATRNSVHDNNNCNNNTIRNSPSYTVLQPSSTTTTTNYHQPWSLPLQDSYIDHTNSPYLARAFHSNDNNNDIINNKSNSLNDDTDNATAFPPHAAHKSPPNTTPISTHEMSVLQQQHQQQQSLPSVSSMNHNFFSSSSPAHKLSRHQQQQPHCFHPSSDNQPSFSSNSSNAPSQHDNNNIITTQRPTTMPTSDITNELLLPPFSTAVVDSTTGGDYTPPQSTSSYSNDSTESKQFTNFIGSEPDSCPRYNNNNNNNNSISTNSIESNPNPSMGRSRLNESSSSFSHQVIPYSSSIAYNGMHHESRPNTILEEFTRNNNNNENSHNSGLSKKRQFQQSNDDCEYEYEYKSKTKKSKMDHDSSFERVSSDNASSALVPVSRANNNNNNSNKNTIFKPLSLCIHLPDNLRLGLSILDLFPYKFFGRSALAPFMKMCYNLNECVKANSLGGLPQSLLQPKPALALALDYRPLESDSIPSLDLDSILALENSPEVSTKYPQDMTYDVEKMDKLNDCLQKVHDRHYGPKTSFLSDSEIDTAMDMFSKICQLQDTLQGRMNLIDDEKYFTILNSTGLDVDKRKEWIHYVFDDFDAHFIRDAKFFRALPGFKDFTLQDRITLTKSTFFAFVAIRHCRTTDVEKDISIDEELGLAMRLTNCRSVLPGLNLLKDRWDHIMHDLKDMNMSFDELIILKALLVIFPDLCDDLEKPELVTQWHNMYRKCLLHQLRKTHAPEAAEERFGAFVGIIQRVKMMHELLKRSRYALADTVKRLADVKQPLFKEIFLNLPYRQESSDNGLLLESIVDK